MEKKVRIKNKSSISALDYIIEHAYWGFIIFITYKNLLFIPLNNFSVSNSKIILVTCMIIVSIIGILVRWKKYMTTRAVLADVMTGVGIYTLLAYEKYYIDWMRILFIAFLVILIFYISYIFTRKSRGQTLMQIENRRRKRLIIKSRMFRTVDKAGLILGIFMIILVIPIGYNQIFRGGIVVSNAKHTGFNTNYAENKYGLTYNIDSIAKIRTKERWEPLNTNQRLEVLQTICNCESNYWGMDFEVTIAMDDLAEHTWGSYNDAERMVVIDRQHLENDEPYEILNTVLHEMYHAWEHSLVRLYLDSTEEQRKMRVFQHCEEYIKEMTNYQDGGDNYESFMEYYCQYMEKDSRNYAEVAVKEYYDEIDRILEEQSK